MIDLATDFRLTLILITFAFACSGADDDTGVAIEDSIPILETTNVVINDHQVAVANIGERELPDSHGNIALRMSAILSIMDNSTQDEWTLTVMEGDSVQLGLETYYVLSITAGEESRGILVLVDSAHAESED